MKLFFVSALMSKLQFAIDLGLLKVIPYFGETVREYVVNHPDCVERSLNGGVRSIIRIYTHIKTYIHTFAFVVQSRFKL